MRNIENEFGKIMRTSGNDKLSELEELRNEIGTHRASYDNQRNSEGWDAEDWDVEIRYQQRKLRGFE